jgi:hypothetical protein
MVTFSDLKKNRTQALETLTTEIAKLNSKQVYDDDDNRFWKLSRDQSGNGNAIIRFLPPHAEEEGVFYVRVFSHSFQGPTGLWYIENSLTTIGKSDPVGELNSQLWATGSEANKEIARKQKRRLNFISNVYVVKDPAHPENEGKVFLFKYGKKIFDKLNEQMNPSFEGDARVNPWDLWEGANFRLRIRTIDRFPNYDKSDFEAAGPLLKDDKAMEAIWKSEHKLTDFVAPEKFKDYEVLKAKLNRVLGLDGATNEAPPWNEMPEAAPNAGKQAAASAPAGDDDEDPFEQFKKLAEEVD